MSRILAIVLLLLFGSVAAYAQGGLLKKKPRPYEYGRVIINNYATKNAMAAVTFDHWRHRDKYTCRLCHVDIGFAMKAGATEITAADNMRGYFCGTCHNGKRQHDGAPIFAACASQVQQEELPRCGRCHTSGRNPQREQVFATFAAKLPKEHVGNGIDWEKAEQAGLINPVQFLEGVSVARPSLAAQKDFSLPAKVEGMPQIIFSHQKHTVWNGCELCHPDIFVGIKKGTTKYSMAELFDGKYCGVCHSTVAFPLSDCQRCHTQPVQ